MTTRQASRLVVLLMSFLYAEASAEEPTVMRFIDENLDRVPVQTIVPAYPETARRDRIEGEVQVCYHIDRKGRPYSIAVRQSTHRIFERPARRAIRASSYRPLGADEETSGIKTCRTFKFELQSIAADEQ